MKTCRVLGWEESWANRASYSIYRALCVAPSFEGHPLKQAYISRYVYSCGINRITRNNVTSKLQTYKLFQIIAFQKFIICVVLKKKRIKLTIAEGLNKMWAEQIHRGQDRTFVQAFAQAVLRAQNLGINKNVFIYIIAACDFKTSIFLKHQNILINL